MPHERLPMEPQIELLISLFQQAESQIEAQINQAIAAGALGSARYRRERIATIARYLQQLRTDVKTRIPKLEKDVYLFGAKLADKYGAIPGGVDASYGTGLHSTAIRILVDNLTHKLEDAIQVVGRRSADAIRKESLRQVALHLAKGDTHTQASAQLSASLERQGVTAFIDRRGAQWSLQNYSRMAIRTTTRETLSHGTVNTMIQNGLDLVTIPPHLHRPDECDEFEGKTYSLTGATPGYPVLEVLPPFHPECVHVVAPSPDAVLVPSQVQEGDLVASG